MLPIPFILTDKFPLEMEKKSSNSKITIVIMNRNMVNRQRKKNPNNPNYYSFGVRNVKYEFKSHIFNMEI